MEGALRGAGCQGVADAAPAGPKQRPQREPAGERGVKGHTSDIGLEGKGPPKRISPSPALRLVSDNKIKEEA